MKNLAKNFTNKSIDHQRGYIAIVSALILCSVLTLLALTESISIFWSRLREEETGSKTQSEVLAESCAYEALAEYEEDPSSVQAIANQTIFISSGNQPANNSCTIDSIIFDTSSHALRVQTHAEVASVYSTLYVIATVTTSSGIVSVTSWRQSTSIPP